MAPPLFLTRLIRHPRRFKPGVLSANLLRLLLLAFLFGVFTLFLHNGVLSANLLRLLLLAFLFGVFTLFFVFYTLQAALTSTTSQQCPEFFRWIHQDLSPWRQVGITQQMVESAREFAAFRVVILNGKLYVDLYYQCVQSRAMFTIWGLLMLLQRYPGKVPDVDFMFNCMDRPHFFKEAFQGNRVPPPLFAYCGTKNSFIPFPDWSYWGWAEVNIGPWNEESASIFDGRR